MKKKIILTLILSSLAVSSFVALSCTQTKEPKTKHKLNNLTIIDTTQTSVKLIVTIANLKLTDNLQIKLNDQKYSFLVSNLTKIANNNQYEITINNLTKNTEYKIKEIEINDEDLDTNFEIKFKTKEDSKPNNPLEEDLNQGAANEYKQTFLEILSKNEDNVQITDQEKINSALNAYNNLSETIKSILTNEKTLLDKLAAKIASLKENDQTTTNPIQPPKSQNPKTEPKTQDSQKQQTSENTDNTIIERVTQTFASVLVTLDNQETSSNYKLLVAGPNNQQLEYTTTSVDGNILTFKLDNLSAGSTYTVNKVIDTTLSTKEYLINKEFKTKNQEQFTLKNIKLKEVLDSQVKVQVSFTTSVLEDENNQNYELSFGSAYDEQSKETVVTTNKLLTTNNENYLEFTLSNLQFSTIYQLKKLYINNKEFALDSSLKSGDNWKQGDQKLSFETATYSKQITYDSISTRFASESTDSGTSDKIYLSLEGIKNAFDVNEEYILEITFKEKGSSKIFKSNINISKQKYGDYKNFEFLLLDIDNYADWEGFNVLPKNKDIEIVEIKIDTKQFYEESSEDTSQLRVSIKPSNGSVSEFNTNLNYNNYDQVALAYDKNTKNLAASLNITMTDNRTPNNVKFVLSSDYGAKWTLPATKNADKWTANIPDLAFDGKIFLSKVRVDNKDIRAKSSSVGNTEVSNQTSKTKPTISSISASNINQTNYKSTITVNLGENFNYTNLSNNKPILVYYEEGNEANNFELEIAPNQTNNSLTFETYLKPEVNYKVKYLFFNNQYLKTDLTFKRNKFLLDNTYHDNNGLKLKDDIKTKWTNLNTNLKLAQKWWASGVKTKITDKTSLLALLDPFNLTFDDEVNFIIDTTFNSYNDPNGQLSLKIKWSYKNEESEFKTFNITGLFSKNDFAPNHSNDYLDSLIRVSEAGLSKSTTDFDKTFGTQYEDNNDLSYSFGNKTKWIDLKDNKLSEFIQISERFKNYDQSQFMLYFTKFNDVKDVYQPHKTSPYAMYGFLNYRINAWFESYNPANKQDKPEIKYSRFSEPALISGFNNYSQNQVNDYLTNIESQMIQYSKTNWEEFNKTFGFNDSYKSLTLEQIKQNIEAKSKNDEKWAELLKYTSLERLITRITYFVKNSYNPVVTNELHAFNILSLETIKLGDNNYLRVNFTINALLLNDKSNDNILNAKILTLDLLKNN